MTDNDHMIPAKQPLDLIFDKLRSERERQDRLWGGPAHDDTHSDRDWISMITHYAAKAAPPPNATEWHKMNHFRRRMVIVAALAVAALEWDDRRRAKKWREWVDRKISESDTGYWG